MDAPFCGLDVLQHEHVQRPVQEASGSEESRGKLKIAITSSGLGSIIQIRSFLFTASIFNRGDSHDMRREPYPCPVPEYALKGPQVEPEASFWNHCRNSGWFPSGSC